MKSLLRDDMMDHMSTKYLLSNHQLGCVCGRSTVLQLFQVLEEWTENLDNGGVSDVCCMDFMTAFDSVTQETDLVAS